MGKTTKEQDTYDFYHNINIPSKRLHKLLKYFHRVNFWDWDLKIASRKHKDFIRGGEARIKSKNYKN